MEKVQLNTVKGFEDVKDYYFVMREGDRCWVESINGKVLNGEIVKGYRRLCLYLNSGKQKKFQQHRIFMLVFKPNPENKTQVNHIDGVKTNNLLSNLEWFTPKENIDHAIRTGLRDNSGEQNGSAKLKDSDIPLIFDMRKTGKTQKDIGLHFGVSRPQISKILLGNSRSK